MWSITLNSSDVMNGSRMPGRYGPSRYGARIRCPLDDTGRNSVRPWTMPMISAATSVSIEVRSTGSGQGCRAWGGGGGRRRGRVADPRGVARARLADEERREDEGDRGEKLDEDVERWACRVVERIADRAPDDGRGVAVRALAEHVALVVLEVARLDVLLGVVPRAAAVVQDGGEHDARDRPDHQHPGDRLGAEQEPDDDRRGDRHDTRRDHLAQSGPGRDVDDPGVVRALGVIHDPGHLPELPADLDDDRLGRRADRADRERAEEVDEHRADQGGDEDADVGEVDRAEKRRAGHAGDDPPSLDQ